MKLRLKLSREFVRLMLSGHSILGLTVAASLYLVCVTGTLSVFYPQIEGWEQPTVADSPTFDSTVIDSAVAAIVARAPKRPEHAFITLPTDEVPRLSVGAEEDSAYVNTDGSLGEPVDHEWTHFLVVLHYALTIPGIAGLSIVGVIGIMLTAMVISGLLAHPNIFKDAFSFRLGGAKRLQLVDIHNRLGVWTAPFQLAIAVTGAFIGLSQLFLVSVATLFFDSNVETASRSLFLQHAAPTGVAAPLVEVGTVLDRFQADHPDTPPMTITIHEPATTAQAIEIGARVPRRIVWGEFYLYDADGRQLASAGWSDGDAGVQLYSSMFRLHFGHFAGLPLQIAYFVLGIAMCIAVATGVNIWLLRRAQNGRPAPLQRSLWATTVWGTPLALALSAFADTALAWNGTASFWIAMASLLAMAWRVADVRTWTRNLQFAAAATSLAVVTAHWVRFGDQAFQGSALTVNVLWFAATVAFLATALGTRALRASSESVAFNS